MMLAIGRRNGLTLLSQVLSFRGEAELRRYFRRADIRRVAATPRPRRGESVEMGRGGPDGRTKESGARRRYLGSCDGWRWDGCTAVPRAQGGDVHLVVLTRREGDVVLRDAAPPPRSPKSAVAAHAWPRTVDAAHAALFPELCGEYPLDEFRRDLAAYFKGDCPAELSAEDAEGFLRVMG